MAKPLVSVIMPVYNAGGFLADAVDSILAQRYHNIELIIVNDASTDGSGEYIRNLKDPRITKLENHVNRGIVLSRNRGISMARGKYVAVLDSDDIALPDRIERQVAFLEANPDHGLCGSFYHVIDSNGKKLSSVTVPVNSRDARTFLYFNVCFCHSTLMMRTNVARIYEYREGFDIIEDYEIAYRIARQWKVANIPVFTTLYRVHGSNITIGKKQKMLEVRRRMDSIVLNDLGLHYNERILDMHSNFINMNDDWFRAEGKLQELETWLMNFYDHMLTRPDINISLVRRVLAVRWALICYRTGHYREIIRNRLLRRFGSTYLAVNLGYMGSLARKKLEVV